MTRSFPKVGGVALFTMLPLFACSFVSQNPPSPSEGSSSSGSSGSGGSSSGGDGTDGGSSDGGAQPLPCRTSAECPLGGHDPSCATATCDSGFCGITAAPRGTAVKDPTVGDCRKLTCDGAGGVESAPDPSDVPAQTSGDCRVAECDTSGNVVEVADDNDVPTTQNQCAPPVCSGGSVSTPPKPAGTLCSQNGGRTCDGSGACKYCPNVDAQCTDTDPGEPGNGTQAGAFDYGTLSNDDGAGKHECGILKTGDAADWFTFQGNAPTIFGVDAYVTDPAVLVLSPIIVHACIYIQGSASDFGCPSGTTTDVAPNGAPGCCGNLTNNGFTVKSPDDRRVWIKLEAAAPTTCAPYDLQFHD